MKIQFTVFWLDTQREIYGDDSYYVLGELMGSFNTELEAVNYIEFLNLKSHQSCTIVKIYTGN
jgi:hypothetical protein